MFSLSKQKKIISIGFFLVSALPLTVSAQEKPEQINYLNLAQGTIPVGINAPSNLGIKMEKALQMIDGDSQGYVMTPKPGTDNTSITIIYQLPALTTFTEFAIPNILETPSPSQTFFQTVEISGSSRSMNEGFTPLASQTLSRHSGKNQITTIKANKKEEVRWVKITLKGGLDVQKEKTFFEFSEIIGYGSQKSVPLLNGFTGKWKGRGVLMELSQQGVTVAGCYDREGKLTGTVSGNVLRATGKNTRSGVDSSFVLTLTDQKEIVGVRSTNKAPFKLYTGDLSANINTNCSEPQEVAVLGCESIVHGINFDYNSAKIRPDSAPILQELAKGLKSATSNKITVIGHTSSEGSDSYNQSLSQRRAESVVQALVQQGINSNKISALGKGESQPIADNSTEAGRSLNRRVEISCQ